ncbi:MAG: alpha-L-arabinofuranosidase C-terminal domain-containing protein [Dehalococcoidia bacterium]
MKRASLRVRTDQERGRIHRYIYGQFIEHMGRCVYGGIFEPGSPLADERGFRRDVIEAMRGLRIPILRYPGGCFSDEYHWRDGIGPPEQRPRHAEQYWTRWLRNWNRPDLAPLIGPPETNAFGTDEYLALCAELACDPYLNLNHGTGTPEEAADWLAYCNKRPESPKRVAVAGVGNEVFGFWETGHCSGEEYGRHFLRYREAIRKVDPSLKLLAVGAPKMYAGFTEGMLKAAGPTMDYVSVHAFHPPVPGMRPLRDDEPDYWAVVAGPYALIRNVDDVLGDIDRALGPDSPVRVSFDEWNLWCTWDDCYATNYDLRAGLMFAGTFHRIHERAPRLEIAMIAQLVNLLGLIQTNQAGLFLTAGYLVNRLYVEETRPLALQCDIESATFDTPVWPDVPQNLQPMMGEDLRGIPYLDASATASEDRGELAIFLINRYLDEPLEVSIALEGSTQALASGRLRILAADSPFARNDFGDPHRLAIAERAVSTGGNSLRLELPPHSLATLILSRS